MAAWDPQQFVAQLHQELGDPLDLVVRPVPAAGAHVLFLESLVEPRRAEDRVLGRLLQAGRPEGDPLAWLCNTVSAPRVSAVHDQKEAAQALADGDAVVVLHTAGAAFRVSVRGAEHRPPESPETEMTVRGPRDGFTETLVTNLALLRGRIHDPRLRVEEHRVGRRSRTRVALVYHADLARPELVAEVRTRLAAVQVDRIVGSGELEQWLEDHPHSLYPQVQTTERPDRAAAAILEGRIAILVDGDPYVLLLPAVMVSFFQAPDEYYQRWIFGSLLRWVRLMALAASLLAPSLYVAMTMYNPELLPLKITLTLAASREGIPFPIVVEALIMEAMMELLREAGIRLPRPVGQPMAIVGGLVMGELAVRANLVSPIMVVLVGLTGLGSFALPSYEAALATRILRFPLVIFTGMFGITGTVFFVLVLAAHLCTLRSLGVPYLTPFAQAAARDWLDTLIRAPVRWLTHRPETYTPLDRRRVGGTQP